MWFGEEGRQFVPDAALREQSPAHLGVVFHHPFTAVRVAQDLADLLDQAVRQKTIYEHHVETAGSDVTASLRS